MRNPGDKSGDRAPGRRRNPAPRGGTGPAQETGAEPAPSGSALFVPGYSGGRDGGPGQAPDSGHQGAGYPAGPGGTASGWAQGRAQSGWGQPGTSSGRAQPGWAAPGSAQSGWGQGRATATKGPVRGFPPAPGQPPPLYPPGQFSAWNRAQRPGGDQPYGGPDDDWDAGGPRDGGGYPAGEYGQGGSWGGGPGPEQGGDPGYGAQQGYADPGYSVLAVSDPAADVTSTQTWAAVDTSPFWDDAPDTGPQPSATDHAGGPDRSEPGNGHPLDRHTAPGHTGWPEATPDDGPPAGTGEWPETGPGEWPAGTGEWPVDPAGQPGHGSPANGTGTGGFPVGGPANGDTASRGPNSGAFTRDGRRPDDWAGPGPDQHGPDQQGRGQQDVGQPGPDQWHRGGDRGWSPNGGQQTTGPHSAQPITGPHGVPQAMGQPETAGGPAGTVAVERPGHAHTGWPEEPGSSGPPSLDAPGGPKRAGAGGAGAGRRWGRRKGTAADNPGERTAAQPDARGGPAQAGPDSRPGQARGRDGQPSDGRRGQDAQGRPDTQGAPDRPETQGSPGGRARAAGRNTGPGRVVTGPGQVVGTGPGRDGTRADRQSVRRARRKRQTRVLIAAGLVVVVLVVVGGAYALFGRSKPHAGPAASGLGSPSAGPVSPSTAPSPSPSLGKWGHIASRTDDPTALSLRELYPAKVTSAGTTYTRTAQKSSKKCTRELIGSKLKAAVHKAGCTQVLRASYLSGSKKVMGTVGVLNLVSVAAAEKAGKASGGHDFIAQLAAAKGPTHHLTKGTGLEETEVKGHYLVIVWSEFANLKAPKTKGQRLALETFCNRVLQTTANQSLASRLVTGKPRTSS
jgi:hypothetical protein